METTEQSYKSLYIDFNKKIFELDGKPMNPLISEMYIELAKDGWRIRTNETRIYRVKE